MGDHLESINIYCLLQFGYDWQKYQANEANLPNFTAQLDVSEKLNCFVSFHSF